MQSSICLLLKCERGVPIQRCNLPKRKIIEGAVQKSNGKWSCPKSFPGREFDDLDAYRAAKKQRAARREEYRAQIPDSSYQQAYRERRAAYDQARTNPCAH